MGMGDEDEDKVGVCSLMWVEEHPVLDMVKIEFV